jgi:hypothetical protein
VTIGIDWEIAPCEVASQWALVAAKMCTDLQDQFLVVVEALVFICAELKVCPFFIHLLLLTIYHLLDLLRLPVRLDELSRADRLRISIFLGAPLDDVEDSDDIFRRAILQFIDCQRISSRNSLPIDMLIAWSIDAERWLVVDFWLHRGIFERHLGSLLRAPAWGVEWI